MKIGVLAQEGSWYFQDLQRAAAGDYDIQRVSYPEISVFLRDDSQSAPLVEAMRPDAMLVRSMPIGSLEQVIFRMDALRKWEDDGVLVLNSPPGLEIAIDKALTLIRLNKAGLPFPATAVFQQAEPAMLFFQQANVPMVIKPVFGGEGRGLIRVSETEMAYRVFKTLEQTRSVIYCQEFLPNVLRDIRILIVGKKAFAMTRENGESWITNAAQGGTGSPYQPTDQELEFAFQAAEATETKIAGVDLLVTKEKGIDVIEVNAVPGWKSLSKVLGIDIAREILDFIRQESN